MLSWLVIFILLIGVSAYFRLALVIWSTLLGVTLFMFSYSQLVSLGSLIVLWAVYLIVTIPLNLTTFRKNKISLPVKNFMANAMPSISQTEQEALDAGSVWWEGEIFSGMPDYSILKNLPKPELSTEEQAFLDGPVNQLCEMIDDWEITQEQSDLPKEIWQFIKDNKFMAMIIPKKYGGLEFSALAHSEVVMKVSSRSITAAVTVMVPNSLGPGKLLLHYGTDEQKEKYLYGLADGTEIPCFGLTGPDAGSDAGAMPDTGVVCYGAFDGKEKVLGIRLNWDKRYITLGPVATLIGLAFKLYDPDKILGDKHSIGITLALIRPDTAGVEIGNRHFPLNQPFMNGPNRGKDVFIPMDWVIGGEDYIGQGWRMLMECLADGRAISLPALSTGAGKLCSHNTGAYARIRKQFRTPIGYFEGVEEALATIAGQTYAMDAARELTLVALDIGESPSVVSAIVKYQLTERMRQVLNLAMDVHGGHAICMGPSNFLGRVYQAIPISITVEGANILTRSMIVFGQGALRSHPYLLKEVNAVHETDAEKSLHDFDQALFGHIGFVSSNIVRAFWLGLTQARFMFTPGSSKTAYYYRQLNRLSACFAVMSDMSLAVLGGGLKRREKISGRLADALSNLYILSALLKRFENDDEPIDDVPLFEWAAQDCLYNCQRSIDSVLANFPIAIIGKILRLIVFPRGKVYKGASDRLSHKVARIILSNGEARRRLTQGIYFNDKAGDRTGRIELAFEKVLKAADAERKLKDAMHVGVIKQQPIEPLLKQALSLSILTDDEARLIEEAHLATHDAIMVDEFSFNSENNIWTWEKPDEQR
ncbi:MAG: acyl-CoA dehydrogenase [Gammaproteobacteria bacterium]|nr:acyl-CoA dehydrogenase [Gammaproteobacteria bacterium]